MIFCESVEIPGKHYFTLYHSLDPYRWTERRTETEYTHCAWARGTESQFVVDRKFIRELYNTSLKFNIRVKIL